MVIKHIGKLAVVLLAIGAYAGTSAQTPDVAIKVIGASYFEAPPNRDKNLAVFGAGTSQEKVEVQAVALSANKRFIEKPSPFQTSEITVTAILPNKSMLPLGTAELGSFHKTSADAKMRSVVLSVNRLPDQPILGLVFEGPLAVQISNGFTKASSKFEPRVGAAFSLNDVKISLAKIEGQVFSFKGDSSLARIRSIALKQSDGRIVAAERAGWSSMNSEEIHEWKFASVVTAGVLSAEMHQPIETIKIPLRVVVGKPF